MKKLIMIALFAAFAARGGTGTLTFDWIHADTAGALSAGNDRDKLDAALTNEVDPVAMAALAGYATTGQLATATANLDETDPRAMKLYHYGDPDIEITPAGDFGFDAGSGTITGYTGSNPDIVLPYEINGVPVVAIGDNAFESDQRVTKITSPRTLTSIGEYAFQGCSLTTLTAPALTDIAEGAFYGSSLTTLTAPSLTSIGNFAFQKCLLTTLTAPALTSIGNYVFYGSPLTTLTAPALTSIGNSVFYNSPLTTLTAPALTSIGDFAFQECLLTTLTAPALTSIGDYAFYDCSTLTSVYYGSDKPMVGEGIYDGTPANLVNYVTNPTATGWGATFGGRPVVRPDLYADAFHGSGAALTGVTKPVDLTAQYSAWTTNVVSSGTNIITSAWGNQPRLELTDAGVIDFDFGTPNGGIHRLTLSLWSGTNSVAWLTNNVDFAEAPELSTNSYNTILIRKIGSAKAEGRQL